MVQPDRAIGSLMPKRIYKDRFDRFVSTRRGRCITSAAYDQKAMDVLQGRATGDRGLADDGSGEAHSPFALALFDALAGDADFRTGREGDGVITATEVYAYVRDRVEPETLGEGQSKRQTPGFFPLRNHDKGEFIFLHPKHRLNLRGIPNAVHTRDCSRSTSPTGRSFTGATARFENCRPVATRSACSSSAARRAPASRRWSRPVCCRCCARQAIAFCR